MIQTSLRNFIRHVLSESLDLDEGGNVQVGERQAEKIEIARVGRQRFVEDMRVLFRNIDQRYRAYTQELGQESSLYRPESIERFLSGPGFGVSTGVFFDLEKGLIVAIQKDAPHDMKEFEFVRNQPLIDAIYHKWNIVSQCLDEGVEPPKEEVIELPVSGAVE